MYGEYEPMLVYGIEDSDFESCIDEEWLNENFPGIEIYPSSMIRNCMCSAIYGIVCDIDINGVISISDEEKKIVDNLYEEIKNFKKYTIGYMLCISTFEYESLPTYIPNESNDDSEAEFEIDG